MSIIPNIIKNSLVATSYVLMKRKTPFVASDTSEFPKDFDLRFEEYAEKMFDWSREKDEGEKAKKIKKCVKNVRTLLGYRGMVGPQLLNFLCVFHKTIFYDNAL